MLVELLVAPLCSNWNRGGNSDDFSCACIYLAPIPVPDAGACVVEGVSEKAPVVLLGYGIRRVENSFWQSFAGGRVFPVCFEFDPAFADAAKVSDQAFVEALQIVWAHSLCVGKAGDLALWLFSWLGLLGGRCRSLGFNRLRWWCRRFIVEQCEWGGDHNEKKERQAELGYSCGLRLPAVGALSGAATYDVSAAFAFLAGHGGPSSFESGFGAKVTPKVTLNEVLESWGVRNGGNPA